MSKPAADCRCPECEGKRAMEEAARREEARKARGHCTGCRCPKCAPPLPCLPCLPPLPVPFTRPYVFPYEQPRQDWPWMPTIWC